MSQPHWACPSSWCVCPPCPHCSGSRLLRQEPSKAGPGLHAPPRSKLLKLRHSGSPQRHRLVGPAFWALPRSEQLRCLASAVAAAYRLSRPCCSVFWCTAGVLSQADHDRPEPQEVLVSKEACLPLWGCDCPLLALQTLAACHQREMVCSRLILSHPLFCSWSWCCLMLELFTW